MRVRVRACMWLCSLSFNVITTNPEYLDWTILYLISFISALSEFGKMTYIFRYYLYIASVKKYIQTYPSIHTYMNASPHTHICLKKLQHTHTQNKHPHTHIYIYTQIYKLDQPSHHATYKFCFGFFVQSLIKVLGLFNAKAIFVEEK